MINLTSTTDSAETVAAAIGDAKVDASTGSKEQVDEKKSVSALIKQDEISEDSDASSETQDDDVDTKEGDEDNEDDSSDKIDEKPKRRNGFKKRIDKLNSKLSAKEQEVEYWKAEAFKKQAPQDADNKPIQKEAMADKKPKADDFDSHDKYVEALTDWKMDQRDQLRDAKQKEIEIKTDQQKRFEAHQGRVKEFAEAHDDFKEVIAELGDYRVSPAVEALIIDSDLGAEVLYELAKDQNELDRLCSLPPLAAAREFGKYEMRFDKSSEPEKKEVKKSKPAPLKTVGANTGGATKKSIYDKDLSQAEFERLRSEELRSRRA